MPLNYLIPEVNYLNYSHNFPLAETAYEFYQKRITFETDSRILKELGAINTEHIQHPHIFYLLNEDHQEHIHEMFKYVAEKNPDSILPK